MRTTGLALILVTLALVAVTGCGILNGDLSDEVHFFVQEAPAAGVMQALYEGDVVAVGDCLRLKSLTEEHTVIWPYGFRLGGPGDRYVLDDRGRFVGEVGKRFRLGGGEVPTLWDDGPVAEAVRQLALSDCPGKYWLVGEVG